MWEKRLFPEEFSKKLNLGTFTVIDLRTSQEQLIFWTISEKQEHIDIYQADATQKIQKLPREGKYLLYCYHGNRSEYILSIMQELWFQEVYDLIWGIDAWKKTFT